MRLSAGEPDVEWGQFQERLVLGYQGGTAIISHIYLLSLLLLQRVQYRVRQGLLIYLCRRTVGLLRLSLLLNHPDIFI